jgi:hypothetical protein
LRWEFWEAHHRFRGNRCWNATKIAMPITDPTRSIATMMSIADTCDELRSQSVINYGLKFRGVVVTTIGRECGPINLKISVWQNISKQADANHFTEALIGNCSRSQ